MLRRPPIPTLFPYTTLFRSACHQRPGFRQRDWASRPRRVVEAWADVNQVADAFDGEESEAQASVRMLSEIRHPRSEEHTSELQSRLHLVCRLLLEKKKTTPI